MGPKYLLTTLGCKVNQYESQQIRETLGSLGLTPARQGERADIAIVNTCAVTASASRKNRQAIRRASRNGTIPVYVIGCGATADADTLRAIRGVAAVFGHDVDVCGELRRHVGEQLQPGHALSYDVTPPACPPGDSQNRRTAPDRPVSSSRNQTDLADAQRHDVWMIPSTKNSPRQAEPSVPGSPTRRTIASTPKSISHALPLVKPQDTLAARIESFDGHQRAFLKIQDGCDAFCTYCIIPRLRPQLRSKPVEVAVEEARTLVASGHKEIILTGIFLGAYERETAIRKRFSQSRDGERAGQAGNPYENTKAPFDPVSQPVTSLAQTRMQQRSPLAELVDALAHLEGLERLRLSSLEPGDVDDDLLAVLSSSATCVPHLHLPLQSGSERILRRMNRQYTRDDYLNMIDRVSSALDRPAITTDIIVGFPGEDESDFEASCDVARQARFCKIHAFPFSPRDGTAAARWRHQFVPTPIVRQRMARLAEIERECALAYRSQFIGDTERVIVEGDDGSIDMENTFDDESTPDIRSGRSDRYFDIHFETDGTIAAGDVVHVRIDRVTPTRTHGVLIRKPDGARPLPLLLLPTDHMFV
jgi:threonylcarbamoyladenosine tRNA methylthiotransferase MtaB